MTIDSSPAGQSNQPAERADEMAASVIQRETRRSTIAAWTMLSLWLLVAAGFVAYNLTFFIYFYPILANCVDEGFVASGPEFERLQNALGILARVTMNWAYVWAGLVALAAGSTAWYIRASRRATLSQIHVGLAEISEQLKALAAEMGKSSDK